MITREMLLAICEDICADPRCCDTSSASPEAMADRLFASLSGSQGQWQEQARTAVQFAVNETVKACALEEFGHADHDWQLGSLRAIVDRAVTLIPPPPADPTTGR